MSNSIDKNWTAASSNIKDWEIVDSEKAKFIFDECSKCTQDYEGSISIIESKATIFFGVASTIIAGILGVLWNDLLKTGELSKAYSIPLLTILVVFFISAVLFLFTAYLSNYKAVGNTPENLFKQEICEQGIADLISGVAISYQRIIAHNVQVMNKKARLFKWALLTFMFAMLIAFTGISVLFISPWVWVGLAFLLFCLVGFVALRVGL